MRTHQSDRAATHAVIDAPVRKPKDPAIDQDCTRDGDSDCVGGWRERTGTDAAKDIYKGLVATA